MPALLEVRNLSVKYGRMTAVSELSLQVKEGSIVALVGANGAGKSSTVAAIAGLIKPTSGDIFLDGAEITKQSSHKTVRDGVVLVPEGRHVLTRMTVTENLQLAIQGSDQNELLDLAFEKFPILYERRKLPAGGLSGGEQQMLVLARALMSKPRLICMDEPSMGLAPKIVDLVFSTIEEIRDSGVAILLVEQNARRALELADYGYILERGAITQSGTATELLADSQLVAAYLGS